jgi:hypothetical protein
LLQSYLLSPNAAFADAPFSRKIRIWSVVVAVDLTFPDELFQLLPRLNTAGPHTAVLVETHLIYVWGVNVMKPVPGIPKGQTVAVMNNDLVCQRLLHSHESQYDNKYPHCTRSPFKNRTIPSKSLIDPLQDMTKRPVSAHLALLPEAAPSSHAAAPPSNVMDSRALTDRIALGSLKAEQVSQDDRFRMALFAEPFHCLFNGRCRLCQVLSNAF